MTQDKKTTFENNVAMVLQDNDIQGSLVDIIDVKCNALVQAIAKIADGRDPRFWGSRKVAWDEFVAAVEDDLRHLSPEDRAKVEALSAQAQEAGIGSGMDAVLDVAHSQLQSFPKLKEALDKCSDKPQPGL